MLIGYARISTTDQTLVKRNPLLDDFRRPGVKGPGPVDDLLVGYTGTRIPGGGFSVSTPAAPEVRQSSEVPQRHRTGVEGEPETHGWAARFMANRWGIGSVNVTL